MAKTSSWNPIAFVPTQVSLIATALYAVLFTALIYVHTTVPSAPSDQTPLPGINLTSAWLDLSYLSNGPHPVDSRRNEQVRNYLLERIDEILDNNGVGYKHVEERVSSSGLVETSKSKNKNKNGPKAVTVFDDKLSNVTFIDDFSKQPWTCYSESTNIIVYIRGKEDPEDDFWDSSESYSGPGGVLVNAHFDSVSSGLGATDDGVGVVTILQLISYYTSKGQQPNRGLVALLNNNEEDGLYGAHEFLRHPISQFTHIFMNLEGAAAGGRAQLFRSTDSEVTRFYSSSPYPFGSVVSLDGFRRGFVRSGTDYSVFNGDHRMRGIDVAFYEQRSKYHTDQDSARETSPDSLWHMLSAAISTTEGMTGYDGDDFDASTRKNGNLDLPSGSDSAYFDLFGRAFAVFKLDTLFALSVALLVAGPILLIVLEAILRRSDKWYLLSKRQFLHSSDDDEAVHFSGLRGLFRFPIAFIVATAAVLALSFLLAKINAFIVYSSEYAVWIMMLSAWFSVAWFFLAGGDRVRPTALQRMYSLIWIYALTWLLLVGATVGEHNFNLGSGYFIVIYNASAFAALIISYFELLALPTKTSYVEHVAGANDDIQHRRPGSQSSRSLLSDTRGRTAAVDDEADTANERTSLLGGGDRRSGKTFSKLGKRPQIDEDVEETDDKLLNKAYGDEQPWSSSLPQWTWILQLLLLAPINVIIVGQISLLLTTALHQTPADGNPVLSIYLFVSILAALLLLPLMPFMHRLSYRIATLLFLVFIGCLIYNLVAFPFSSNNRLKVYFLQQINLDTGDNNVTLGGLDRYVQDIIGELPSASGQTLRCGEHSSGVFKQGLQHCSWSGLMPNVLGDNDDADPSTLVKPHSSYKSWLDFNATAANGTAEFHILGQNTKKCRIVFSSPVSKVDIDGTAPDPRYHSVAHSGSSEIRLFSRGWENIFKVRVAWPDGKTKGKTGTVVCLWNEVREPGVIPAFDEVMLFQPVWSAVTKGGSGLVEGYREFKL